MNQTAIFWPMLAHVLLVYVVYLILGLRRFGAVRSGVARLNHFRDRSAEPATSVAAANNIINQFELPVLFHVVCLALYVTGGVSFVPLVIAWIFILSRYVHAGIHLTVNSVRHRSYAFQTGLVLLGALWIWFSLRLAGTV